MGSKQYGEETQKLQEPERTLGNATHLPEPVPAGIFWFVCVSSALVSRHQSVFETFHVNRWFSLSDLHCMMFVKR